MAIRAEIAVEIESAREQFALRERLLTEKSELEAKLADVIVRLDEAERGINENIEKIVTKAK